ncbi:MAG: NUDIX domain-containing protein [Parcubacteria group bacterium]|nr:NUDIX domain-containing protein [Parcubacteria group bacterium]MCR4342305.1 NUDIX domain-containing protein [Patescibacteria group bacterium]
MFYFIKIINILRKIYWFIFRPTTIGVRLLNIYNNEVLLVKHTYSSSWYLPGGGAKNGIDIIDSLKREIKEELNIDLNEGQLSSADLFGVYDNFQEYKNDYIFLFILDNLKLNLTKAKNIEIEEAGYFNINNLPGSISAGTKRRINEFLSRKDKVIISKW